jgi:hypothetical protein
VQIEQFLAWKRGVKPIDEELDSVNQSKRWRKTGHVDDKGEEVIDVSFWKPQRFADVPGTHFWTRRY